MSRINWDVNLEVGNGELIFTAFIGKSRIGCVEVVLKHFDLCVHAELPIFLECRNDTTVNERETTGNVKQTEEKATRNERKYSLSPEHTVESSGKNTDENSTSYGDVEFAVRSLVKCEQNPCWIVEHTGHHYLILNHDQAHWLAKLKEDLASKVRISVKISSNTSGAKVSVPDRTFRSKFTGRLAEQVAYTALRIGREFEFELGESAYE